MKHLIALCLFFCSLGTANALTFAELMQKGKDMLRAERARQLPETSDYKPVVAIFEKAVKLQPASAEAHYFLGYALDYTHSNDAGDMIHLNLARTVQASSEFETVIRLSPNYTGEIMILDPYAKISSIWGSQAMCYLWQGKNDSATMAFREGKKRGGFSNFALAYYRMAMRQCGTNAIYFHMGDYSTFSAWYLQQVEHFRTDVRIINPGMLQIPWYSTFLNRNYPDLFPSADAATDTLLYAQWQEKVISIPVKQSATYLNWTVYPDLGKDYILRGSLLYAGILEKNAFNAPVYYEHGFDSATTLGLYKYLQPGVLADQLMPYRFETPEPAYYDSLKTFPMSMLQLVNKNSDQDISAVNYLRYAYFVGVKGYRDTRQDTKADALLKYLLQQVPEAKYPLSTGYTEIIEYLKGEK